MEGPAEGGTPVQIAGTGFIEGTTVHFGDLQAGQTNHVSDELLVAVTPAQLQGPVDVTVESPLGQVATLEAGFTFTNSVNLAPAPIGLEAIPAVGPTEGEIAVTILGEGFQPGAVVLFGDVAGNATFTAGDGVLSTRLPPHAAGEVAITVVNPDGQAVVLPESFVFEAELVLGPSPALTALDPAIGPTAGGNLVTVYGAGFAEGLQIWFGNALAPTVTVISELEAQVAAPANNAGVVDVLSLIHI